MKRPNSLIFGSIFLSHIAVAQTNYGARLAGMGNNIGAVKDVWGVASNPASAVDFKSPVAQISHQQYSFDNEIRSQALAAAIPIKYLTLGFGLQKHGIPEFYDSKVSLVLSKLFGPRLGIGFRGNYHQLKISNYGSATALSVDLGASYQLSYALGVGLYINNPTRVGYRSISGISPLPSIMNLGITYRTNDKLLLATTIWKKNLVVGIEYEIQKALSLRSGLSFNPFTQYFGAGFSRPKFTIDFACIIIPNLSYSPQLTVGYVF